MPKADNFPFWDWATGDDRVVVFAVSKESYGSDNPNELGDIHYYNFGEDDFSWNQSAAETAAENLCEMHNQAVRENDADTLALCDLIASGGIQNSP